jgi:hypothetical protein
MISIALLASFVTATGNYDCTLDKGMMIVNRPSGWELFPVNKPTSRANVALKGFSLMLDDAKPRHVIVTSSGNPLNLAGRFEVIQLAPNLMVWSVQTAANCPLLDAQCAPAVQLFVRDQASAVAAVSLATYAAGADRQQMLGSTSFLFSCKRQAAGQKQ